MLSAEAEEAVKRRFRFEEWAGTNVLGRGLFVQNYHLPSLEGWRLASAVPVDFPNYPPSLQTIWVDESGISEAVMRIDVYECASRLAAHEFLIHLLGEIQSAMHDTVDRGNLGDLTFIVRGGQAVMFTRANLTFFIARAGAVVTSPLPFGSRIDADVIEEPVQPFMAMAIGAAEEEGGGVRIEVRVGEPVTLDLPIDAAPPPDITAMAVPLSPLAGAAMGAVAAAHATKPTVKIFSSGGEARLEKGRVAYVADQPGVWPLSIYVIGDDNVRREERVVEATE